MLSAIKKELSQSLLSLFKNTSWQSLDDITRAFTLPKNFSHGHLALPVFALSKELHQNPHQLASQVSKEALQKNINGVTAIEAISGFINFKFSSSYLQKLLCDFVFSKSAQEKKPLKKIIIEYSSPNVAKPLGIGHLRATVIGHCLCHLAKTQGFEVIRWNHLGDWGVQFGNLAYAYQKWSEEYDFETQPLQSLYQLYVRFHDEIEKKPELKENGTECFRKLEAGDPSITQLWQLFISITLKEHKKLYDLLGVTFDVVQGESFYKDKLDKVVQRIQDAGCLEESKGAFVVFLDEGPPCLIKKSDGSSLYATRDIASALYRHEIIKADELLYVVGSEQSLHFKQIFGVLDKMKLDWARNCHHISFGLYRFKDSKMSTRKGNVIFMADVLKEAIDRTHQIIEEKKSVLQNKKEVAKQVGVGAVIFNDLLHDRIRDIDFDWSKVLDFDGDSGPYAQYCLVRCRSLLRKYQKDICTYFKKDVETQEEIQLLVTIMYFPETLQTAWKNFKPHTLAQYVLKLCQEFNTFYNSQRILGSNDKDMEDTRMTLVYCVENILNQSLSILGVPTPSEM